jgi:hypothetical protein
MVGGDTSMWRHGQLDIRVPFAGENPGKQLEWAATAYTEHPNITYHDEVGLVA